MKKHYYILLFTLLNCLVVFSYTDPKDSTAIEKKQLKTVSKNVYTDLANLDKTVRNLSNHNSSPVVANTNQYRSFPELKPPRSAKSPDFEEH